MVLASNHHLSEKVNEMDNNIELNKAEWRRVGYAIFWLTVLETLILELIDTYSFSKTAEKVFKMLDNIVDKVGKTMWCK